MLFVLLLMVLLMCCDFDLIQQSKLKLHSCNTNIYTDIVMFTTYTGTAVHQQQSAAAAAAAAAVYNVKIGWFMSGLALTFGPKLALADHPHPS
jgi:hypothetical protein